MLIITVQVNAPPGQAIGVKEDLAMYLEQFGDSRVVSVEEVPELSIDYTHHDTLTFEPSK